MVKVMSRSSIVSVFEKTRFRHFVSGLPAADRDMLTGGLNELIHGDEHIGFQILQDVLRSGRLAKWTLMTVCQTYYHPQRDVFIKPTTVKGVIQFFELENLQYKPTPSWDFYNGYRSAFLDLKSKVDKSLSPTNPAFSGFLWMSIQEEL
jgi:hypothetical protein